jgi:methylmalonyl-CoA mutase C-terminal domain/subunit
MTAVLNSSSLSGAHMRLFPAVVEALAKAGAPEIPVLGGGVIPDEDILALKAAGIVEIFTPGTPVDIIISAFQDACEKKSAG